MKTLNQVMKLEEHEDTVPFKLDIPVAILATPQHTIDMPRQHKMFVYIETGTLDKHGTPSEKERTTFHLYLRDKNNKMIDRAIFYSKVQMNEYITEYAQKLSVKSRRRVETDEIYDD